MHPSIVNYKVIDIAVGTDNPRTRRLMKSRVTKFLVITLFIFMSFLGLLAGHTYNAIYSEKLPLESVLKTITIAPGMTVSDVARMLKDEGIVRRTEDFIFTTGFLKLEGRIQAGKYQLIAGESNWKLLSCLTNAGSSADFILIPEGLTSRQIAKIVESEIGIDSTDFMEAVYDEALMKKYGITAPSLEGYLFPDSYNYHQGMSAEEIIEVLLRRFFQVCDSTMIQEAADIGLSVNELVTLASIIAGEMSLELEAPLISAVYHNRIKNKMKLQADPTVQYIIKGGPRRLYNNDLAIESPYNTYLHRGLPPGAVCNPGRVALEAALHPAEEPYLYLVSAGDGSHAFNLKFEDHLEAKAKLDSIRKGLEKREK